MPQLRRAPIADGSRSDFTAIQKYCRSCNLPQRVGLYFTDTREFPQRQADDRSRTAMKGKLQEQATTPGNQSWFTVERGFVLSCWFLGLGIVVMLLTPFEFYHSIGYTCANTGSNKGHTRWFWGQESGHSHTASPIETYMLKHHPDELAHRWVQTAGTGRNIFGKSISWGHGRTQMTRLRFHLKFPGYWKQLPQDRLYSLYQKFSTGTDDEVEALIDEIDKDWFEWVQSRSE